MEYEVSLQTIAWFNSLRSDESLEISPDFQRRSVWMDRERSELMETIISGLPFPEIYIHVVTDMNTGKQTHIVVDGQQRTTSILMFIDNQIQLPSITPFNSRYFKDLNDTEKESFWDYKVVVRSLRKTNIAEIRSLFTRLNTNNITLMIRSYATQDMLAATSSSQKDWRIIRYSKRWGYLLLETCEEC